MVKGYLKYDDVKIFRYENFYLSIVYTIGHIFVAMICNRIITGASLDMAAADAFIEPILNGFWFYLLLVHVKKILVNKIAQRKSRLINSSHASILLAFLYTIGHILIAMTCNRLLTGSPLNLAVIDALVEPIINGFWFYFLFEVFSKLKKKKILSGIGEINRAS
tara:strand:- start:878 stop:1369 length:492 start_codon:yes stop_codon:yes gene_type:complete